MTLKEAKEFAKNDLDKANVVVVTSDKATYLLKEVEEIQVIKKHAELNKLEMFVLKPENEIETEVKTEVKENKKKK